MIVLRCSSVLTINRYVIWMGHVKERTFTQVDLSVQPLSPVLRQLPISVQISHVPPIPNTVLSPSPVLMITTSVPVKPVLLLLVKLSQKHSVRPHDRFDVIMGTVQPLSLTAVTQGSAWRPMSVRLVVELLNRSML